MSDTHTHTHTHTHNTLEKLSIIQCYIHHVKGVEVKVAIPQNRAQIFMMNRMYEIAHQYFVDGGDTNYKLIRDDNRGEYEGFRWTFHWKF